MRQSASMRRWAACQAACSWHFPSNWPSCTPTARAAWSIGKTWNGWSRRLNSWSRVRPSRPDNCCPVLPMPSLRFPRSHPPPPPRPPRRCLPLTTAALQPFDQPQTTHAAALTAAALHAAALTTAALPSPPIPCPQACLLAAQFLWHLGEVAQSREHASRLIELQPQSAAGLSLLGWLDLDDAEANGHGLEEDLLSAAAGGFERALKASPRSLDALVGLARVRTASQQYQEALDRLQQAIAAHPWFFPAHVEKCDVLVAMGDWEQAVEVAEAVLAKEPAAIEARRIKILYLLVHRSSYGAAAEQICELVELLDRHEPQNAPLFCRVARSFARLSGRNAGVLQHTRALMERACTLAPASCAFAAELGYQQMLSGNLRDAHQTLKQASTLEAASTDVVLHQIKCLVLLGQTEDAEQQLEFVSATMLERTPEMALCEALLARGWGGTAQALSLLDEAFELQMQAVRDAAPGERYLTQLCPDRLLEIAREFMRHCPSEPEVLDSGSVASNALAKATRLLELVTRKVPGLLEGQMLLAQARFLLGDFEAASRTCSYCVAADPSYVAASLLHARVLSLQGKLSRADGVLEQALAHNFGIRDSPQYALIKGKALQSQGDLPAAASLLETAMAAAARPARRGGQASGSDQATPQSRCDVYLQLAEVYLALDRRKDAKRLAREAAAEFAGGPEEGRMSLATARLELKSGNVEKAIQMLCGISSASPQFLAAQKDLALLYLNHRGDRHKYAQCHLELVKANPSAASYVMLGEAYMHISEPREALAAFEQALQADPSNSALSSRIGKVLVTTLQYARAVEYYEGAVQRDPSQSRLRHELAELCLRLKKHDRAESELLELLAQLGDGAADLGDATQRVEALRLLAKVHQERGGADEAINELLKASEAQQGVLARVRVDAPDLTGEQGRVAADVACQLGELYELKHNGESAIASHEAALRHCSGHERSSLALARLRMLRGELESAEVLCVSLLRVDPGHQDAVMALADVMQQRSEWGAAVDHLRSHLETRHADFRSIAKLLQVLRRAGRLEEADAFLNRAERSSPHAAQHAGFRLCKGLLTLYRNNPRSALQFLNLVRNDAEWGPDAAQAMIEIYLDPDRETNWDELELASSPQPSDAVRACERLLRELPRSQRQQARPPPSSIELWIAGSLSLLPDNTGSRLLHAHGVSDADAPREGGVDAPRAARRRPGVRPSHGLPLAVLPYAQAGTEGAQPSQARRKDAVRCRAGRGL